ncbi:hypothetical protein [Nonomuraea sp. NPDC001699]
MGLTGRRPAVGPAVLFTVALTTITTETLPMGLLPQGQAAGWRTGFAVLSGLSVLLMVAARSLLPGRSASPAPSGLRGALRLPSVRIVTAATALVMLGQFTLHTYLVPYLGDADQSGTATTAALFVFGAAGILAYAALPTLLQTFALKTAPHAVPAASTLFIIAFNVGITAGSALGGQTLRHLGPGPLPVAAVLPVLAAAVTVAVGLRRARRTPHLAVVRPGA